MPVTTDANQAPGVPPPGDFTVGDFTFRDFTDPASPSVGDEIVWTDPASGSTFHLERMADEVVWFCLAARDPATGKVRQLHVNLCSDTPVKVVLQELPREERAGPGVQKPPAESERLREALTWAVGFIRCNFPRASTEYPDMRNAEALVERRPVHTGEFQLTVARAEVAEAERDKLRQEAAAVGRLLELIRQYKDDPATVREWCGNIGVAWVDALVSERDAFRRLAEFARSRFCDSHSLDTDPAAVRLEEMCRELLAGKGEG